MTQVKVEINDTRVQQAFTRLLSQTNNLRPFLKDIGEHMLLSVESNFDRQQAPDGTPWAPLSIAYLKSKKGPKTLTESRALRRSITYRAEEDGVSIGTNLIYGAIHQLGGTIQRQASTRELLFRVNQRTDRSRFAKRKKANFAQTVQVGAYSIKMPARPFLGVSTEDCRRILEILICHLTM
ncbi:phage virion morphogenesis protein [Candidatus Cyanaurora vandensis]|uniref:phage virion morphogenesis protein n=1 Tax=Candidatus Cyanaurora vandensis TaxID=2714958 RepID=UPI0025806BDC|nr:phage virion morphogenesis protein [Candidatus Cyanaurora vandensis]